MKPFLEELEPRIYPDANSTLPAVALLAPGHIDQQFVASLPAIAAGLNQYVVGLESMAGQLVPFFQSVYRLALPQATPQQAIGLQVDLFQMQVDLMELAAFGQFFDSLSSPPAKG